MNQNYKINFELLVEIVNNIIHVNLTKIAIIEKIAYKFQTVKRLWSWWKLSK